VAVLQDLRDQCYGFVNLLVGKQLWK
jgi:hypothetical protein